jgi:hypothetical protein
VEKSYFYNGNQIFIQKTCLIMYTRYVKQLGWRFLYLFSGQKRPRVAKHSIGAGENIYSPGPKEAAEIAEFERIKKGGYGYFTFDSNGELAGVGFSGDNVLIPSKTSDLQEEV